MNIKILYICGNEYTTSSHSNVVASKKVKKKKTRWEGAKTEDKVEDFAKDGDLAT